MSQFACFYIGNPLVHVYNYSYLQCFWFLTFMLRLKVTYSPIVHHHNVPYWMVSPPYPVSFVFSYTLSCSLWCFPFHWRPSRKASRVVMDPSGSVCLGTSPALLHCWMTALLGEVFLVAIFLFSFLSVLWRWCSILSWPEKFLLRNLKIDLWIFPYVWWIDFSLFPMFSLVLIFDSF